MSYLNRYLLACALLTVIITPIYADTTDASYNLHANQPVDTALTGSATLSCDNGGHPATVSINPNSISSTGGPLFYIPEAAGTALMGQASTGKCTLAATLNGKLSKSIVVTQEFTVVANAPPNTTQIKSITITKVSGAPCILNDTCQSSSNSLLSVGVSQNKVQDSSGKWYAQPCICPIIFHN